ncbi:MAG: hypothetical protein V3S24_10870, partial [Candidatus Tectomicrobia bacterium]
MVLTELLATVIQAYRERKRRKKMPWLYAVRSVPKLRQTAAAWVGEQPVGAGSEAEQMINRHLAVCSLSAVLATAGLLVYPPLRLFSVPGIVYVAVPIFRGAYREFRDEGKVTMTLVYSMLIIGTLFLGRYVAMSLVTGLRLLGQKLLFYTEGHSKESLVDVLGEQPYFVWIQIDELEVEIPFKELQVGDIVMVHAGETVPVDGTIAHGLASIDQHVLTGESQPVEKGQGDCVFASTVVLSGKIGIAVEKAGHDTVAAQIGEVLR